MFETLFTGFVGGVCAWFLTEYIAKPLQRFVDLRREVSRCLVVYGNVAARAFVDQAGRRMSMGISPEEDARLVAAQDAFRDLAGKLRGFANVDYVANRIVARWGYDADKTASALIGYSNELPTKGGARADYHDRIQKLLRISPDSQS